MILPKPTKKDYVEVTYNEKEKPFTTYPKKLIKYLANRYNIKKNDKLIELGCGRGEFLKEFLNIGVKGFGIDQSTYSKRLCPAAKIENIDLLKEKKFPFPDNFFDFVYSKSFVEHFYYPEFIFEETYRVLKPGGKIITLAPDWKYFYKNFYEEYSHRTPFTEKSIRDIQLINGFINVKVECFRQLPIIWKRDSSNNFYFLFLSELTRIFFPSFLKKFSKWIFFSKEIMILTTAEKSN